MSDTTENKARKKHMTVDAEKKAEERQLKKEIAQLEKEIASLEAEQQTLHDYFVDADTTDAHYHDMCKKLKAIENQISDKTESWERLYEKL